MNIGIYKITSPTNKIYIGQSKNIDIRWKYSYYNLTCKDPIRLFNPLKKHGVKNHKFEIIEECAIELLNEREIYWKLQCLKDFDNDWNKVLFCKTHDSGGGPLSKEHRDKISNSLKGKKHSEETKIKMSNKATGRKYSEQSKQKMSLSKKGNKFLPHQKLNMKGKRSKPILQFSLEGVLIKEWESFKDIKNELGFNNSGLCFCCKGKQKTAYNYIWKYKENKIINK